MNGLEDLNQKIIIVVAFTGFFLLVWWYVKTRASNTFDVEGNGKLKHIESRRLAHAAILSVFEVNQKTVLILQDKQGASVLDISETGRKGRDNDVLA
jgi:hypothetical protein